MILNRLGNKKAIAHKIIPYFPPHDCYIELFAGTGAMFFAKPQAKYNILNDIDEDIYNMWQVVKFQKQELITELENLIIHEKLWKDYKKIVPEDKVFRAALFLMYSNFGYMGDVGTLHSSFDNSKENLINKIQTVFSKIQNVKFTSGCFRKVYNKLHIRGVEHKKQCFIYADPPYYGTTNNYSNSFTLQDTQDLFKILVDSKIRFALSEFDNPKIIEIAESYNLNIHIIGERRNMKNRRTEILITNYSHENLFNQL